MSAYCTVVGSAIEPSDNIAESGDRFGYAASRPGRITPEIAATLTHSAESTALSKDLKKRGFSFVGPTTMYAFMQSMGIVNDHLHGCHANASVEAARQVFKRP